MKLVKKHGILNNRVRAFKVRRVILHHTAGGTVQGAVSALRNRGLGYHYMIDKDGTVYEFAEAHRYMAHAYRANRGTLGIAFIGGGKYGAANACQLSAVVELLEQLKLNYPSITEVTGHKHVDRRGKHLRRGKIDPRFEGEPEQSIDWETDRTFMKIIAREAGLTFINRKELYGTWE
jgi:N-acetyl-anhydromuramyl-L-alanine amidase AmpD